MIKTKGLVLLTLVSFVFFQANAQIEKEQISLILILNSIQERFGYHFSYVDKELESIRIPEPPAHFDLKTTITYLEKHTPFQYIFLNKDTITISLIQESRKVCGIIKDINNQAISNASIQGVQETTVSDENGAFSIKATSNDEYITISYLGYKTRIIAASNLIKKPCKIIQLAPHIEHLNEIVLRNYLIKGISKQSNGSIVIDYTNYGILPGLTEPDLLQTIQALPGITSINETVSDLNVRGGTNDQNLILWDGIKIYQSSHFFGLISAFNPYLTKNVQLYKNGSSSMYGDGVSSVISMNTSNEIQPETKISIGANLISMDAYIDTPIGKKSSLQLAARHSINKLIETPTYKLYFDKAFQDSEVVNNRNSDNAFSFYDISLRWLYQLSSKDFIKVNTLIMDNDLEFKENSLVNQTAISRRSKLTQSNKTVGIKYLRNWNPVFQSEVLVYGTNYTLESLNANIDSNQRLLQENQVLEDGLKINTLTKYGSNTLLTNGYQFNETGISNLQDVNNPTFRERIKEVIRTHSLFSELEYKSANGNNYISMGARINYYEKFKKYFLEPRISLNKRFANHFRLEILGEIKTQATSQIIDLQNDFLGVENRRWVLSNDKDIPIIKGRQLSLGISYNDNNWLINSDFYYKKVIGIITRSQGFQNQFEFARDHGNYEVLGIDLLINKRFQKLSSWLSYSFADNRYTFNNLSDPNFPNNIDIRHMVNFAMAYELKNIEFSAGINWHSGKPTTLPNSLTPTNNSINYKRANSSRLKNYVRMDVSATYNFKIFENIGAYAGISIWNFLGRENIFNNYFKISDQGSIQEINQFGLRRTPNLVFRLNF